MENLRLIQDAANRAKRIVESLLRFSRRPREEEKGPVQLAQVVDDALFLLSSQLKDGHTEVIKRCEPVVAMGNANQLQQIVVNLLVNALQAMGGEGSVIISTGEAGPGRVQLSVSRHRPRRAAGGGQADLRAVLHHQAGGAGDGAGPVHLLPDRRGARRDHPCRDWTGARRVLRARTSRGTAAGQLKLHLGRSE